MGIQPATGKGFPRWKKQVSLGKGLRILQLLAAMDAGVDARGKGIKQLFQVEYLNQTRVIIVMNLQKHGLPSKGQSQCVCAGFLGKGLLTVCCPLNPGEGVEGTVGLTPVNELIFALL